jgi:cell division protein FtsA
LGLRPREVSREDIRQAAKTAQTVPLSEDRQVLHLFPQNFILDEQDCSRFPVGMVGRQLTVHAHIVTAAASAVQNIVTVMNRAGIYVEDTVYEPLASSDAVLKADERQRGVCVCNIGAASMDVVVFHEGVVVNSSSIPTGRGQDRNSAYALTSIRGGRDRATIRMPSKPGNLENKVPLNGDRTLRLVPQRPLSEAQEARARKLVELLRDNLRQAGVLEMLGAGVVFVGGGARLPGLIETAEAILRCPTRMGLPMTMPKLPALLCQPEFATVIGMALYAHRTRVLKTC